MFKRILTFILVLTMFCSVPYRFAADSSTAVSIGVSASSAVLMEASTGQIIYSVNADERRPMASTTKIMTALVALRYGDLDMKVRIPKEAVGIEGSSIYMIENEVLTLRELLYALMLQSANDAATAIAIAVGGSVEGFASLMNATASELGLKDTSFDNPHGLDSENHYTTARELAIITRAALENEFFLELVSTKKHTISQNGVPDRRLLVNHNRLLRSYDGCIGVKTGFTKRSGRCLVSAAKRDGVTLISVTLNAPDDWNDHKRMLDHGFSLYKGVELDSTDVKGLIPVVGGKEQFIHYASRGSHTAVVKQGTEITRVTEMRQFYYAPVKSGDIIGRVVYYGDGEEIASFPIYVIEGVSQKKTKKNFFQWLLSLIGIG